MHHPHSPLLAVVLSVSKNLDHTDKDVDKVQLKLNALIDSILLNQSSLSKSCTVLNLLNIVKGESTKHSKSSVKVDSLSACDGGGTEGENHRCEGSKTDDCESSEKRTSEPDVFVLRLLSAFYRSN
jgi:hypothetical protein